MKIQKEADQLYRKHVDYQIEYLNSHDDPWDWLEIQKFKSKSDAEKANRLDEVEPRLRELFEAFINVLDDKNKEVVLESFESRSF